MYFIAIFLPPVAVLMCGKPGQALLNCLLTLCLVFPGSIHACLVVGQTEADRRLDRSIRAADKQAERLIQAQRAQ